MGAIHETTAVAGWYPSPDGLGQRFWDGARWTDQLMRAARHEAPADTRSPGMRLRDALASGWRPEPRPALIALASTEEVYAQASVQVLQFGGTDSSGILGEPSPDTAPGGWHQVDEGTVYMTSSRFACQLGRQFANVPYTAIADAYCDSDGVCVWQHGRAPVKIRLVDPEWHFVLFRWLAYGEPRVVPA